MYRYLMVWVGIFATLGAIIYAHSIRSSAMLAGIPPLMFLSSLQGAMRERRRLMRECALDSC
jgi:hypothetical protein